MSRSSTDAAAYAHRRLEDFRANENQTNFVTVKATTRMGTSRPYQPVENARRNQTCYFRQRTIQPHSQSSMMNGMIVQP